MTVKKVCCKLASEGHMIITCWEGSTRHSNSVGGVDKAELIIATENKYKIFTAASQLLLLEYHPMICLVAMMALNLNHIVLLAMAVICVGNVDCQLNGDVQTEIRVMKEEISGIKDTQKMTAITMMGFTQMMKSVDSRVTNVAKGKDLVFT